MSRKYLRGEIYYADLDPGRIEPVIPLFNIEPYLKRRIHHE